MMMTPRCIDVLPVLASAFLGLLPACRGTVEQLAAGDTTSGGPGGSTASSATSAASASSAASSSGAGGGPSGAASVRFANFVVDGPPFDVCDTAGGTALLAAAGLDGGLQFGQVSRYLPAATGAAWTLVQPGSLCGDPWGAFLPGVLSSILWPTGADVARVTVVLWFDGDLYGAKAYIDEPTNDQHGINVRALNFAVFDTPPSDPGVPIQLLTRGPGDPAPQEMFSDLAVAAVPTHSPMGPVSAAGFVHTHYVEVGRLVVNPQANAPSFATTGSVPIPGQGNGYGVASIFIGGAFYGGTARAVVCADDAPAVGALSACTIPPQ
jgi:hypothetical protein